MIGIGASVPGPVDRDAVGGALTGREVGQEHFEDIVRLEHPGARELLQHRGALRLRCGIEMRIQPRSRDAVEAAHGRAPEVPGTGLGHLEAQPRALPADEEAGVELIDLVAARGDEVMVEGRVVELDRVDERSARRSAGTGEDRADREIANGWPEKLSVH